MLQPAHVGHLAMLRSLIRQGAQDGSFDRELVRRPPKRKSSSPSSGARSSGATSSKKAAAAASRPLPFRATCSGPTTATRVPSRSGSDLSRNRGRLRAVARGCRPGSRGGGHGRQLLTALFATPQGQKTYVVRVQRGSRYAPALQHLLHDFGFDWSAIRFASAGICAPTHRPTSPRAFATPSTRAAR